MMKKKMVMMTANKRFDHCCLLYCLYLFIHSHSKSIDPHTEKKRALSSICNSQLKLIHILIRTVHTYINLYLYTLKKIN